jgi:hypothetical protein
MRGDTAPAATHNGVVRAAIRRYVHEHMLRGLAAAAALTAFIGGSALGGVRSAAAVAMVSAGAALALSLVVVDDLGEARERRRAGRGAVSPRGLLRDAWGAGFLVFLLVAIALDAGHEQPGRIVALVAGAVAIVALVGEGVLAVLCARSGDAARWCDGDDDD